MRDLATTMLNIILPPTCPICRAMVGTPGDLCPTCWEQITFITDPLCDRCGLPFETKEAAHTLCGGCVRTKPEFNKARAVMVYDDFSRRLLLPFKNADRTDLAPALGLWLARAGLSLIEDSDIIAPVALHWTRMLSRRYNQSALLAARLGKERSKRVSLDLLKRTKKRPLR